MKNNGCKKGFTLIELLVVVLIIGILAAIALLPQYQKAVQRSKNAQLKAFLKTIRQAENTHLMTSGKYTANFSELPLDLPLSAPPQVSGTNESICNLRVQGTDSVRRGKDFDVILNSTDLAVNTTVVAVWTKGKYKCMGFQWGKPPATMKCAEYNRATNFGQGDFCEKIEKGFNKTQNSDVAKWDLP